MVVKLYLYINDSRLLVVVKKIDNSALFSYFTDHNITHALGIDGISHQLFYYLWLLCVFKSYIIINYLLVLMF